ncbi:MAG: hypothetical protein AUH13_02895 [Acidobacteria bacterium 13_2_20CM_58_27]|nr:MAG: hypothetical protein AUH13_02895 [Acidobacteria bacterium 13_2_20CM_58_27]
MLVMLSALFTAWAITLASSELFMVIVRSREIGILVKKQNRPWTEPSLSGSAPFTWFGIECEFSAP